MTISKSELLMGRQKDFITEYTDEVANNIDKLLICLNKFRTAYGKPMIISSGWRPSAINSSTPGAAKRSNHMLGLACDFRDPDGKLAEYCLNNLPLLEKCGLWMEDPKFTKNWVHLQSVPPKSKRRVFIP
jgi:hypothetical protein